MRTTRGENLEQDESAGPAAKLERVRMEVKKTTFDLNEDVVKMGARTGANARACDSSGKKVRLM